MSNEGLVLSGARDMHSSASWDGFVSYARHDEEYLSPDKQINNTRSYNEMDFYRIQDGTRKQPDYIVVFSENEEIKFLDEARIAQEQWGGLPIVVIDKDKCLEAERQKVEEMKQRYEAGDKSLAGDIYQKVRNNRVTRENFCSEMNLEKLREEAEAQEKQMEESQTRKTKEQPPINQDKNEEQVGIEDLAENYDRVTPQERKDEVSAIRRINTKINELVNQKDGENVGR